MWLSILPGRISAGSSLSTWFVVNTKTLSLPHADHSPSTKLSRPDSVTLLLLSVLLESSTTTWLLSTSSPLSILMPLRLVVSSTSMASMSSITMMDLSVVSRKSFRSSALSLIDVRSRSYTS
ncbi:hypothetical protein EE612_059513 [Oryza sativa]|nr:hypothetical protein EE612_059513 [Oryza sativa]